MSYCLSRNLLAFVVLLITVALPSVSLTGCTDDGSPESHDRLIIIPDRTGVAHATTWEAEVAAQTQAAVEQGFDDGVDRVDLVGLGSNTNQAATVASADLGSIEGNTAAKREAARQVLVDEIAAAAGQIAAQPVDTVSTDVLAALDQAASLCRAPDVTTCSVLVISDLEDQRVTGAPSVEAAVEALTPLMPDLAGVTVQVSGLGASGADAATVEQVRATWQVLFEQAGAVDVRIARSL